MNILFSGITFLYMALALLQILIAPRIGPNPYFGFRIGYSFSNKEVWKKSNRFVGILMFVHSLILVPFSFLSYEYLSYYLIAFTVPLIAILIIGISYASRQLEELKISDRISTKPIEPFNPGFVWKHIGLLLFLVLLFLMLATYNFLPAKIAVHFNSSGEPNGWSDKFSFFWGYLGFALTYLIILYLIIYAGKRYPIILHSGTMKIGRDTVFKTSLLSMHIVMLILIFVYVGIFMYNVSPNSNTLLINSILIVSLILAMLPVTYIIYRWKKEKEVRT